MLTLKRAGVYMGHLVLERVREDIKKFSPYPNRVKIVAVSKQQSERSILSLYGQGHTLFAENYLAEAKGKIKDLAQRNLEWHYVGCLQTKKISQVISQFSCVHTVTEQEQMEKMNAVSKTLGKVMPFYIQVNVTDEVSKGGIALSQLETMTKWSMAFPHLKLLGFMAMPPLASDNTPYFNLLVDSAVKMYENFGFMELPDFSMGTSQDYLSAIKCGSTCLRLGRLIFGDRS